ncbi:hypothetical protein T08_10847 [Trichinella sp. T8]|nr:hypothetical protein T08_10847 [Trichinella sp. T8]
MAVGKNALPSQWQWERQVPPLGHQNRQEALFLVPVIPMTHQWAQSNMSTYIALANDQRKSVIQAIFTSRKFFPDPYGQTSFSIVDHQITSGQHGFGSLPSIS